MTGGQEFTGFEIAIVGAAGRFPGAASVDAFWRNLCAGVESVEDLTDEELLAAGEDPALLSDPRYVKRAARLADIDLFDAAFFGVTPREAEIMDPQHRLFLETAWTALESAGYDPSRVPGPVGVYGGASTSTYIMRNLLGSGTIDVHALPTLFGNQTDYLTTRVSYKLDLEGPSFDVQTSCSSSLVAVHLASQALLSGECDVALAGGVSVAVPHGRGYVYQEQGIYSPDGHCRAFSKDARGTVGGHGVACVVLRRLADALEDGDTVLGVVLGSAINNDGADKVGYAAPSVTGQSKVIGNALAMADVPARSIGYVETHGTGTSLGDPIEVAALTTAYRAQTQDTGFCRIGSVKTNIGHLDAAAGVTGLIKAALAARTGTIPPSLNCDEPNPEIGFPSTPFVVNTALHAWTADGPRRAGVSSFGIGGTNAHVIVQEPPAPLPTGPLKPAQLLVVSARTKSALAAATSNLAAQLRAGGATADADGAVATGATGATGGPPDLADVAWTLQVGRKEFAHRAFVVATDAAGAADALERGGTTRHEEDGERPVVFLFPGQGSQHVDMARALAATEPVFREALDDVLARLRPHVTGGDLGALLFPAPGAEEAAGEQLTQTAFTQPALFAVEYALAKQWEAWGVAPDAMAGHSIGEYAAAVLAGVFDLDAACALVAARGRLLQDLPTGAMLAVMRPAAEVEAMLDGTGLDLAAVNEPGSSVVSGPHEAVDAFAARLEADGVACRALHTSHAFHSSMMDPAVEPFAARVRAAAPRAPERPFVSTLTGTWITAEEATDPEYWARHLRHAVRFADAATTLLADRPGAVFLEVGPGTTLTTLVTRTARARGRADGEPEPAAVPSLGRPGADGSDLAALLDAAGRLWQCRVPLDWAAVHGGGRRRRVPLPTQPFERQRYWIEPSAEASAGAAEPAGKLPDVADWFSAHGWKRSTLPPGARADDAGPVLAYVDCDPVGEALVARLREGGRTVTVVRPGEAFADEGDGAFRVAPAAREDHARVLAALGDARPTQVLHLWGCEPSTSAGAALDRGLLALLAFAQAWDESAPGGAGDGRAADDAPPADVDVLAVTRGVSPVLGTEGLDPDKATLLGGLQSVTQECRGLAARHVDLDEGAAGPRIVERLLGEVALGAGGGRPAGAADAAPDTFVAWRGPHRWVRADEPMPVPATDGPPPVLREGGHYLVTGGLGSIGLEVATCLARACAPHLLLTTRGGFPDEADWDARLAALPADDDTVKRVRRLRELQEAGATVTVVRADVTDAARMEEVVASAESAHGPLHGVVHAAGGDKTMVILQQTTREDVLGHLRPKREGLAALEAVLASRRPDFCVVQSSLASCLGALGMVGYVAAHHLVDAFVARHNATLRADGLPWTSVNWDNWLSWREPEFVHGEDEDAYYMTPEEGAEAFRRVLTLPPGTQAIVSTGSLRRRLAQWARGGPTTEAAPAGELHARPELDSEYAAPTTPAERALVAAWSEALGIGDIGVHDSFFELGGDSVLGLQIVAKLASAGFRITPAQIFEHPTVAELAAVAEAREVARAEEGPVMGEVPLLPIQRWFLAQGVPDPHHFNLPALVELPGDVDAAHVQAALDDVVAHHDTLRLRFVPDEDAEAGARQVYAEAASVEVVEVDLSGVPAEGRDEAMAARATGLQAGLDLADGPLVRAGLFRFGPDVPARLLWIVHHLLVDAVSWRFLQEDLRAALDARAAGRAPELPGRTDSLRRWGEGLVAWANSPAAARQLPTWTALAAGDHGVLPKDRLTGPDTYSMARTVSVALDADTTRALLQDVPPVYETRIDEVLAVAMVRALRPLTGRDELLLDLEGHGREPVVEHADVSRTVGWFTTLYPARVSLGGSDDPGAWLKGVKEQLRAIPDHGIGFGALRWLCEDAEVRRALAEVPRPDVNLLYLGQFDDSSPMQLMQAASGAPCSPDFPRGHLLEVVAWVADGRLHVDWSYGRNRHEPETVQQLADRFVAELTALVEHCRAPTAGGRTPSDFPGAKVSQKDLDKLLSRIGKPGKGPGK